MIIIIGILCMYSGLSLFEQLYFTCTSTVLTRSRSFNYRCPKPAKPDVKVFLPNA